MYLELALTMWILPYALTAASSSNNGSFDYVVIGGGTAGLVVAARLSEDPNVTVAVIEAGVHHINEPLVDTPELFGQAIGNPSFDWNFVSTPQTALNNKIVPQNRGKMLGGSSGLNFMVWDRASAKEYDTWEKLGAEGWNWKTMLPYFKKTETVSPQTPQELFPGATTSPEGLFDTYHGRSGPLQPSYNVLYTNITNPYVEAVNRLGISTNSDPYTGDATGIYNPEIAIDRVKDLGKRSYAASTYYNISADRPNLTVFLATQATKINLVSDSQSGYLQAASVDVVAVGDGGISATIVARKEVVLSAGALQTPQILELSGIGNKTILESVGVLPLLDLPGIGENFQDHTLLALDFEILNTLFTYDELRNNATYLAEQQAEYSINATGIFASVQFVLAFPTLKSTASPEWLSSLWEEAYNLAHTPGLSALTRAQYLTQLEWLAEDDVASIEILMFPGGGKTALNPAPGAAYISVFAGNMHPFSRGTVHVNSSNPLVQPVIDPKYLDKDIDLQIMFAGTKFIRNTVASQPLAPFVVGPHQPPANVSSDADWIQYIKTFISTIFHPVGTAAMLPQELGGVVDPRTLKVYGTSNLRVVDASIIPLLIATHPQSTVYAIAERASDIIRGLS